MNNYKTIRKVVSAFKVNMGGEILQQPLPHPEIEQIDPFLLIQHGDFHAPGGGRPQDMGVVEPSAPGIFAGYFYLQRQCPPPRFYRQRFRSRSRGYPVDARRAGHHPQ